MEIYSPQHFHDIRFMESYNSFQLKPTVLSTITELETQIQQTVATIAATIAAESTKKPSHLIAMAAAAAADIPRGGWNSANKAERRNKFSARTNNFKSPNESMDNWNAGKSIKITPKLVNENTDKTITEIRSALNKLSTKNMDTQREVIIKAIDRILTRDDNEMATKIAQLIFDIASSNKFLSELYADLYKDLITSFEIFSEPLNGMFDNYKTSLNEIHYVNPNDDYNGYCKYTKTCDSRKALTTFFANLMKKSIIEKKSVIDMIIYMEEIIKKYATEENRTNEVEEITENLFILICQCESVLGETEEWTENIVPKIHEFSKLRKTEGAKYPSMTNRATFKFMDILDNLG